MKKLFVNIATILLAFVVLNACSGTQNDPKPSSSSNQNATNTNNTNGTNANGTNTSGNNSNGNTTNTSTTGTLTFWLSSDVGHGYIDVYVSEQYEGQITHFQTNGITCGNGDVNVEKPAGTYSWKAKATDGASWSGTSTITNGQCTTMELVNDLSNNGTNVGNNTGNNTNNNTGNNTGNNAGNHKCPTIAADFQAWAKKMTDAVAADEANMQCNSYQGQMAMLEIQARMYEACGAIPGLTKTAAQYRADAATTKKINDAMGCGNAFYYKVLAWW